MSWAPIQLTHVQRVTRLYKRSLRHLLSWCIDRQLWREEALELRARFDANKNVTDKKKALQLLEEGEAEFMAKRHPNPIIYLSTYFGDILYLKQKRYCGCPGNLVTKATRHPIFCGIENVSPYKFWSISEQHQDLVSHLHIHHTGLMVPDSPGGVTWERNLPPPPHALQMFPEEEQWYKEMTDWANEKV